MTLEIKCDGEHSMGWNDKGDINDGDEVYCEQCYAKLKDRITELEGEVEEKNKLIEELEQNIADLKSEG